MSKCMGESVGMGEVVVRLGRHATSSVNAGMQSDIVYSRKWVSTRSKGSGIKTTVRCKMVDSDKRALNGLDKPCSQYACPTRWLGSERAKDALEKLIIQEYEEIVVLATSN